ncbi:hypothetical protein PVAP13_6NG025783 [Panicum virgatum]|uniref:Uncharacterized protein n=1 Tax=Panicum virgatum TaxID=38727 RepID=A0A8T0QTL3_PANVG|nr:hypothetical protein PVAP13_6NG025783 [Panicum virgatum]
MPDARMDDRPAMRRLCHEASLSGPGKVHGHRTGCCHFRSAYVEPTAVCGEPFVAMATIFLRSSDDEPSLRPGPSLTETIKRAGR